MRFFTPGAPDCFDCFKVYGTDMPYSMACFLAGHKGTHHLILEEEE